MDKAQNAGHYYCQSPKIGSIFAASNFPIFKQCAVELSTVFNLWKRHKMTSAICKEQMMLCRSRGTRGAIQEVEYHEAWQRARQEAAYRALLQGLVKMKPFEPFRGS